MDLVRKYLPVEPEDLIVNYPRLVKVLLDIEYIDKNKQGKGHCAFDNIDTFLVKFEHIINSLESEDLKRQIFECGSMDFITQIQKTLEFDLSLRSKRFSFLSDFPNTIAQLQSTQGSFFDLTDEPNSEGAGFSCFLKSLLPDILSYGKEQRGTGQCSGEEKLSQKRIEEALNILKEIFKCRVELYLSQQDRHGIVLKRFIDIDKDSMLVLMKRFTQDAFDNYQNSKDSRRLILSEEQYIKVFFLLLSFEDISVQRIRRFINGADTVLRFYTADNYNLFKQRLQFDAMELCQRQNYKEAVSLSYEQLKEHHDILKEFEKHNFYQEKAGDILHDAGGIAYRAVGLKALVDLAYLSKNMATSLQSGASVWSVIGADWMTTQYFEVAGCASFDSFVSVYKSFNGNIPLAVQEKLWEATTWPGFELSHRYMMQRSVLLPGMQAAGMAANLYFSYKDYYDSKARCLYSAWQKGLTQKFFAIEQSQLEKYCTYEVLERFFDFDTYYMQATIGRYQHLEKSRLYSSENSYQQLIISGREESGRCVDIKDLAIGKYQSEEAREGSTREDSTSNFEYPKFLQTRIFSVTQNTQVLVSKASLETNKVFTEKYKSFLIFRQGCLEHQGIANASETHKALMTKQ